LASAITLLGLGVHLVLAQQLGLGEQLGAGIARRLLGDAADQLARFLHLPLAREQRRAPRLHLERALRVVDARQPPLGAGVVVLQLGGLREQQEGLRQRGARVRRRVVVVVAPCPTGALAAVPKLTAAPPSTRRTYVRSASLASFGRFISSSSAPSVSHGGASCGSDFVSTATSAAASGSRCVVASVRT
jgi:hypothetical protein